MKVVLGKAESPVDSEGLAQRWAGYPERLLDVGTGDGRFVSRWAAAHPRCFCAGLDPVAEGLAKVSRKGAGKPARGGLPNALFLRGSAEELPGPFAGFADRLTVNFPWGSLLRDLVEPSPGALRRMAASARPGACLVLLLNASAFDDEDYRGRLRLPPLSVERVERELVPVYAREGIEIVRAEPLAGGVPHRTSWGQRLVRGSARETLLVEGRLIGRERGCGAENL